MRITAKEWCYTAADGTRQMDLRVTTTRLRELYADGELDEDTPVWAQGMAAWRPIKDVWQLQWQLLPAPSKAFLEQASNDKERRRRRRTQALIRIKRAKKAGGEGKESKGTDGDGEDVAEEDDLTNLFWGPEKPDEAGEGEGDQDSDADSDSEMDGTGRNAYRAEGDPLTSVLEAVQLGHIALDLLFRLVTLHKSIDATGAPVRPPPRAKRLLASSECLPHIAQLVLVGNPDIVDSTSKLLTSVAEHNPTTSAKLYLTGIYYFAAVYTGSNFVPLAKFLCATHLKQAFRTEGRETLRDGTPIRQRSILGEVLPESLLCIMENYGAERFAEVFLGNHDNPEVIWKYEMRQYLIKMVMQHIGDLSMRCQQNTMAKYEYVPIPGLRFEQLEEELWCHNYYLRNLCNEERFPNWPIKQPVELLKAVLDAWRNEIQKDGPSMGEQDALDVLGLAKNPTQDDIRTAYRKLARKYHPDRNPEGRPMFEKLQVAYELLTSTRASAFGDTPDPVNVALIVRTQCILFRRYGADLKPYKYAGYPMLLKELHLEPTDVMSDKKADLLVRGSELVYLTCLCCALNAKELTREDGVEKLAALLQRCLMVSSPQTPATDAMVKVATHVMHTFVGLGAFLEARQRVHRLQSLVDDICRAHAMTLAPRLVHLSLQTVSRLAIDAKIQEMLLLAGVLWKLLPLVLQFDHTLDVAAVGATNVSGKAAAAAAAEGESKKGPANTAFEGGKEDEVERPHEHRRNSLEMTAAERNTQADANRTAKLAARALSRLGGFLSGDKYETPKSPAARACVAALLTPALAKMLNRKDPTALLKFLNENAETPTVIWNGTMRRELMSHVEARIDAAQLMAQGDEEREGGVLTGSPAGGMLKGVHPAFLCTALFEFRTLADELRVGFPGVYVRVYNEQPDMHANPGVEPEVFTADLLEYMAGETSVSARKEKLDMKDPDEESKKQSLLQTVSEGKTYEAATLVEAAAAVSDVAVVRERRPRGPLRGRGTGVMAAGRPASLQRWRMCLEALRNVITAANVYEQVAAHGLPSLFEMLEEDVRGPAGFTYTKDAEVLELRGLSLEVITAIAPNELCANAMANTGHLGTLIHLLRSNVKDARNAVLNIMLALSASSGVVAEMLRLGCIVDLLHFLCADEATAGDKPSRVAAARVLSKFVSDNRKGSQAMVDLQRFVPEGLALLLKEEPDTAPAVLDSTRETPEVIWNDATRQKLQGEVGKMFAGLSFSSAPGAAMPEWKPPQEFRVAYPDLDRELTMGGVYVRIFLKDPKFNLRDPRRFLEELLRTFIAKAAVNVRDVIKKHKLGENVGTAQVPGDEEKGGAPRIDLGEGSRALVAFSSDDPVLTPITSAIVCLLKIRVTLRDHAAHLGYAGKLVDLMGKVANIAPRAVVSVCCLRIIHQLAESKEATRRIGVTPIVQTLKDTMEPLHPDSGFTLEVLKRLLEQDTVEASQMNMQGMPGAGGAGGIGGAEGGGAAAGAAEVKRGAIVGQAMRTDVNLIRFLSSILDGSAAGMDKIGPEASAVKVHTVAIMKLLEADAFYGAAAQSATAETESWEQYKHQKHDLFISTQEAEKRDLFLTVRARRTWCCGVCGSLSLSVVG